MSESQTKDSERLRSTTLGTALHFKMWGTSRALTKGERDEVAEIYGVSPEMLSASHKLIRTKNKAWKALTKVKNELSKFWKDHTLAWVEEGKRLLPKGSYDEFKETTDKLLVEFFEAVQGLGLAWYEIVDEARAALNGRFREADYPTPEKIVEAFGASVEVGIPLARVDTELLALDPVRYEEESRKVALKFEMAVELAESAFAQKLADLVNNLSEALKPEEDGTPRTFKKSTVENLQQFFKQFRSMQVRDEGALNDLVSRAESLLGDRTTAQELRDDKAFASSIAKGMDEIKGLLKEQAGVAPRRVIMRKKKKDKGADDVDTAVLEDDKVLEEVA